jgi:hypothetical protein
MDTHEFYFWESQTYGTFTSPPASGTLSIQGGVVLPAGSAVSISYSMSIHGYGSSGALATGTGFADFQITPEPSSLSLLLLGALVLAKRRRRLILPPNPLGPASLALQRDDALDAQLPQHDANHVAADADAIGLSLLSRTSRRYTG